MSQTSKPLRLLSALIFAAFSIWVTSLHAQSLNHRLEPEYLTLKESMVEVPITQRNNIVLANRAIAALKQLQAKTIIYGSLRDFEADGRLGRVSFDTFNADFHSVSAELEPILAQLPDNKLRVNLANALYSFRDGAFWWGRVAPRRVVTTQTLALSSRSIAPTGVFLTASAPYTVAIHWRQANKFLLQAERLLAQRN